jgi:hypothetical protein
MSNPATVSGRPAKEMAIEAQGRSRGFKQSLSRAEPSRAEDAIPQDRGPHATPRGPPTYPGGSLNNPNCLGPTMEVEPCPIQRPSVATKVVTMVTMIRIRMLIRTRLPNIGSMLEAHQARSFPAQPRQTLMGKPRIIRSSRPCPN